MHHIQYQGKNLMEQICTVEVAIDEQQQIIHLFDAYSVIWPEYNGVQKEYILSEEFYKMLQVLHTKPFFKQNSFQSAENWLNSIGWYFYMPNRKVLAYLNGTMTMVTEGVNTALYDKYLSRL